MRTISADLQAIYDAPANARSIYAKVEVNDGSSWWDLTDSLGRDWVQTISYSAAVSQDVGQCTVSFARNHFLDSLCPLILSSRFNDVGVLLQAGREIRISTATMPLDVVASASDYVTVFNGYIDRVSVTDNISVRCRDYGGLLQDRFIEDTRIYGNSSDEVQVIMQDILDDVNAKAAFPITINLYSPSGDDTSLPGSAYDDASEPTSWAIEPYEQQRQPVMQALKTLAGQIAYDLRFRHHNNTGNFRLVMQEPERSSPSIDYTFANGRFRILSLEQSRETVRNVVRVVYSDLAGRRQTTEASDATSITKYGRRFMEISEESTSQIDTSTEANKLRDGSLNELKEPTAQVVFDTPYFYPIELSDFITLEAEGIFIDSNLSLAVSGISHTIKAGEGLTQVTMVGVPSALLRKRLQEQQGHFYRIWGSRNARRSGNPGGNIMANGMFAHWSRG